MKAWDVLSAMFARSGRRRTDSATAVPGSPRRAKGSGAPARRFALALLAFAAVAAAMTGSASAAEPSFAVNPIAEHDITTAKLSGKVTFDTEANGGAEGFWYFQYCEGTCTAAGAWTNGPEAFSHTLPAGTTEQPVEETLTGLKASTEYTVRLAALPFNTGTEVSEAEPGSGYQTFTTDPAPVAPTAAVDPAGSVSYTSAEFAGAVNPHGGNAESGGAYVPIHWALQLSPSGDPGTFSDAASGDLTTGNGAESPTAVAVGPAQPTGLAPAHTYHYQLLVTYAGQTAEPIPGGTFTTFAVAKPTIADFIAAATGAESAHFSAEIDPHAPAPNDPAFDTSWEFKCTPSCGGQLSGPAVSGAPQTVQADAEHLDPNTKYEVELIATNAGGQTTAPEPPAEFTTDAAAPLIIPFGAGPLTPTTADLDGEVDPRGSQTSYWFEWGTSDCSAPGASCQSLPVGHDASAGSGQVYVYVTEHLSGLSPQTTYHYRLLAKSGSETIAGADRQFTTPAVESGCPNAGAPGADRLPNCRAWEMASTPDKNGADVVPMSNRTRAAVDGSAVNFASLGGFADVHGGTIGTEYIAQRTAAPGTPGWQTHGITPAQNPLPVAAETAPGLDPAYDELSADLKTGLFRAVRPITDAPNVAGLMNLYTRKDLRTPGAGSYQLISDPGFAVAPLPFPQLERPYVAGASSDFSHVFFESKVPLDKSADLSSCSPSGCPVQLFESVDGEVRLAGILPDGKPAASSEAGRGVMHATFNPHMVSADGTRVLFHAPAGGGGDIYMRIDGTATVKLNASEKSPPEDAQGASLWTASADDSRIFFSTAEGLVNEDEDHAEDYYMYDVDAPSGHHLTLISGTGGNGLLGIVGASEDGHYLYFMASGRLVPDAGDPIGVGIYVWHDGVVRLIGDFADPSDYALDTLESGWLTENLSTRARVSADGSRVTFGATEDGGFRGRGGFSGYDHGTACTGGGCIELYAYNAVNGQLRCASCTPSGALPTSDVRTGVKVDGLKSGISSTPYLDRALSEDGRWAFFTSLEPLVPEDINGRYDAYSYDTVNDEVHLLSSGTSDDDSYFMDASADGRDAFFVTREQLVGWDNDGSYDLYDARVGGGFPEPAPVPAPCEGESCHAASPPTPGTVSVGSAQPGLGNPKRQRRCPKGKHPARRAGKTRCVPNHHKPHKRHAKTDRRAGR